jgi:hypothetical protein
LIKAPDPPPFQLPLVEQQQMTAGTGER